MDDPGRALELLEQRRAVAVGDAGVDRRRADRLVAQVVLDELERDAGVQEMRGDRVAQPVAGVAGGEVCGVSVANEQGLDLTLPEGPLAPGEERRLGRELHSSQVAAQESRGALEQRLLGPGAALEALDDNAAALEVDVASGEERHLSDPEAIEEDQRKKGPITEWTDRCEECANLSA